MAERKKVGASFSGCVLDIAAGRVELDKVGEIVSACNPDVAGGWRDILDSYSRTVWREYPHARNIAIALIAQGKVLTPRSKGFPMPDLTAANGFWIT